MTRRDIARIEIEARRMRAETISEMIRALFRRAARANVTGARAA